jgi:dCTP diphosphatase
MFDERTMEALRGFRRERDWEQFHTPRNLAISIALEAGELLELFQWARDDEEVAAVVRDRRPALEAEIADVAIYLAYLVDDLGIDLDAAVARKLRRNAERYPVELARGDATKRG